MSGVIFIYLSGEEGDIFRRKMTDEGYLSFQQILFLFIKFFLGYNPGIKKFFERRQFFDNFCFVCKSFGSFRCSRKIKVVFY